MTMYMVTDPERPWTFSSCISNTKQHSNVLDKFVNTCNIDKSITHKEYHLSPRNCVNFPNKLSIKNTEQNVTHFLNELRKGSCFVNVFVKLRSKKMTYVLTTPYVIHGDIRKVNFDLSCKNNYTMYHCDRFLNEIHVCEWINMLTSDHGKLTRHRILSFLKSELCQNLTIKIEIQLTERCHMLSYSMYIKTKKVLRLLKFSPFISKECVPCKILTAMATWSAINRPKSRTVHCAAAEGSKVKDEKVNVKPQKRRKTLVFLTRIKSNKHQIVKKWIFIVHGILRNIKNIEKMELFKVNYTKWEVKLHLAIANIYHDHKCNCTDSPITYMSKWPI